VALVAVGSEAAIFVIVAMKRSGVSGYGVSIRVGAACIVPDESSTQLFMYEPPQSIDRVKSLIIERILSRILDKSKSVHRQD
jgi:hypothetical protein